VAVMGKHSTPLEGVTLNGHGRPPLVWPLEIRPAGRVQAWPKQSRWRHAATVASGHRGWVAAVPVILVNAVAFGAQLGFWRAHLAVTGEAVLVAAALESIAVYLAWQAHLAQLADDSALRLRLAAYGMALLIGALNYSHFMGPGWRPTVAAVTFGMMSAISPWLWSVHSRRASRDRLKAAGLIEPHAVRLGATRWAWHPVRSVRVMSAATWAGETDPVKAIAVWQPAAPSSDVGACPSSDEPEERHETVSRPVTKPPPRPSRQPSNRTSGRDRAAAVIKKDATLSDREVAKRAGVSESTARRARSELAARSTP
jgi:hypothetical protein